MTDGESRELVLCIRDDLVRAIKIEGYRASGAPAILEQLFSSGGMAYLTRSLAEEDESWRQVIPYIILTRASGSEVYSYLRGKGGGERRLHGRRSIGVGGHVSLDDHFEAAKVGTISDTESDTQELRHALPFLGALIRCATRELDEEVGLVGEHCLRLIGLIDDRSNPVARVHFGVVFLIQVNRVTNLNEDDLVEPKFIPWSSLGLLDAAGDFESWSSLLVRAQAVPAAMALMQVEEIDSAARRP